MSSFHKIQPTTLEVVAFFCKVGKKIELINKLRAKKGAKSIKLETYYCDFCHKGFTEEKLGETPRGWYGTTRWDKIACNKCTLG